MNSASRWLMPLRTVALCAIGCLVPISTVALMVLLVNLAELGSDTLAALGGPIWHPERDAYGLGWLIVSSLLLAVSAAAISVLIGTLAALRLVYYAGPIEQRLGLTVVSMMAGLPSISVGLFALAAVTPWTGISATAGTVAICAMICPSFVLLSEGALRSLPLGLQGTATALGYTFPQQLWRVLLPEAWPPLLAGACLALARALGEATAVSLVVGNTFSRLPPTAFDTVLTLSGSILRGQKEATGLYLNALYAAGLVLMLLITFLVLAGLWLQTLHARRIAS